jgi:hypothetical protein
LASILKMEAVRSSETPVNFYQHTRRHILEDSSLPETDCVLSEVGTDHFLNIKMNFSP